MSRPANEAATTALVPSETPLGSGAMFDAIAPRYDLLNRLLSLGIDHRWRRAAVAALALPPGGALLDVATGTGDLAIAVARRDASARVVGVDPSTGMLACADVKLRAARLADRVTLVEGDAQALPFPDGRFDAAAISFGIRNVVDRPRALAEMARVVRPGGRVVVLELGEPRRGPLAALARWHIHSVVPRVGALLSGARAYRHLEASIAAFPPAADFAATMRAAGLVAVEARPLTFGVVNLFVGTRAAGQPARSPTEAGR